MRTTDAPVLRRSATRPIVGLSVRLLRRGALIWAAVFAFYAAVSAQGYQSLYPHAADRVRFSASLTGNAGFDAMIGPPRNLTTTGGFLAWRIGVVGGIMVALWAILTTTRLLRGEEDALRWEWVAGAALTRSRATAAVLAAVGLGAVVVGSGLFLGQLAVAGGSHLAVGDAAWFSLDVVLCACAFGALGACAAQLAAPRGRAVVVASSALGLAYFLRLVGDAERTLHWLVWTSPLGWFESVHPYSGTRPAVLLLLAAWTAAFATAAVTLAGRRDVGASTFAPPDGDTRVLTHAGAPVADALRFTRGAQVGWIAGGVCGAALLGVIAAGAAKAVAESGLGKRLPQAMFSHLATARGYLGLTFVFIVALLVSLSVGSHLSSARAEESSGRLDHVLGGRVSRRRWLWSRIAVALGGAAAVGLASAVAGWLGQLLTHGHVPLPALLAAGISYVPVAAVFLAVGITVFGVAPRLVPGLVPGLVGATFLLELVGSLLKLPHAILDLSLFHHLSAAPAEPVALEAAAVMALLAACLLVTGVEAFVRRDIAGE